VIFAISGNARLPSWVQTAEWGALHKKSAICPNSGATADIQGLRISANRRRGTRSRPSDGSPLTKVRERTLGNLIENGALRPIRFMA
jgi:hypothetical protein